LLDVLIPTPYALHATPHSYKLHREKMYVKGIQSHLMMKSETRVQLITETTTTTTTTTTKEKQNAKGFAQCGCKKATCCTFIAQSLYVD